ncbi:MAG: neutral/alkaline non-lysosomal ceramidase N-terminal domain-containing protein [Candidatus Hydrogenedentes bacterium]|nr:neutral/alkaline non-lysosomal ceramidase N-terminal domain-containing protein [Candidatus Hydrogenedentota bacterium]
MAKSRFVVLCLVVALYGAVVGAEDAATPVFRAGAATSNVTPWLGVSLSGHMADRKADGVHDELHARCLVLDDGKTQLAFAVVDNCLIPRPVYDAAKQRAEELTGIPAANMMMSATHTHTGPTATPCFQSDPDPQYLEYLSVKIADGIARAAKNLAPASIARGSALLSDQVFNRRWKMQPGAIGPNPFGQTTDTVKMNPGNAGDALLEPAGPTDPEVAFLSVRHADGRPLALLANYSLHYVGGTRGNEVSADYFGMFCERVQKEFGAEGQEPGFVAMLSNGTSGDINNIDFTKSPEAREPYTQMRKVANAVAEAVIAACGTLEYESAPTLDAAQTEVMLGVRKPTAEELVAAKAIVDAKAGAEMSTMEEIYARETVKIAEYPDEVSVLLQAFRIGDWGIGAIPCEVFVQIGLAIKAESALKPAFVIELANAYHGYLPTPEQHAWGGYETWRARSSYLEVDAATVIQKELLGLLNGLAEKRAGK